MGDPGAIMSNPGPTNIGTGAILEPSLAIPDLQNWDMGDPEATMSNPGPTNIGTLVIPEPS